jgi:hypothetical protein
VAEQIVQIRAMRSRSQSWPVFGRLMRLEQRSVLRLTSP